MKTYLCLFIITLLLCGLCAPVSAVDSVATVYVSTYAELKEQLESSTYAKIVLTDDLEDNTEIHIAYPGTVSLPVTEMKKELILDLNGHALTINSDLILESGCMLTLCDSKGAGVMRVGRMYVYGRFILESGKIERTNPKLYQGMDPFRLLYLIYVWEYSEFFINGGEIYLRIDDLDSASAVVVYGGTLQITGGSIKVIGHGATAIYTTYGYVEIGREPEFGHPINEIIDSKIEIAGGSIQTSGWDSIGVIFAYRSGDFVMNGGEIIVEGREAAVFILTDIAIEDSKITLTGGTIKSDMYLIAEEIPAAKFRDRTREIVYYLNAEGEAVDIKARTKLLSLPFSDVYWRNWYYAPTKAMHDLKIMTGYPDGSFQPQNQLSRAELVTMLYRYEGATEQTASPFTDVPKNSYYAEAAAWAYENGIVTGTSATTFSPNDPITREQLVTMLYRYAVYKGQNPAASADATQFTDYAAVSDYAKPAVNWAVSEGLLTGKGNQKLEPQSTATRAETAALIARYIDSLE